MEKLTIQCEIVTPLLMHGADKNAELREQSFKGIMRFWWRAIHGNLDLEALKKEENKIFGNTEQKSNFRMKLINNNLNTNEFNPLPHKNTNFKINGFSPNQTFQIEFIEKDLGLITNIFILSTILGGFGQRSRRGFGSIKIIKIIDKDNNSTIEEWDMTCSDSNNTSTCNMSISWLPEWNYAVNITVNGIIGGEHPQSEKNITKDFNVN